MKNKFILLILLSFSSLKLFSQTPDTIFIYDTIIAYDTLYVYDSNKISGNTIQEALFKVDTSFSLTQLALLYNNDKVPLFIKNALLANYSNRADTLKNRILKLTVRILPEKDTIEIGKPFYKTFFIGGRSNLIENSKTEVEYPIEKEFIFQKINNANRIYRTIFPFCMRKDHVFNFTGISLNKNSKISNYKINKGMIKSINDSAVIIKYFREVSLKNEMKRIKNLSGINFLVDKEICNIKNDTSLSYDEKQKQIIEYSYLSADSVEVLLSEIKKIKFSRVNSKNKNIYRTWRVINSVIIVGAFTLVLINPFSAILVSSVGITSIITRGMLSRRTIKMKKWKLLNEKEVKELNLNASK